MRIFRLLLIAVCLPLAHPADTSHLMTIFGDATFQSDFPNGFITTLQVTPQAALVQARLTVTLDGVTTYQSDANIPPHQPGETILLEARWKGLTATRDPAPPWMPLQFWWTVLDAAGNQLNTQPQHQVYSDSTRHAWIASQGVHVSVYTYGQSSDFINDAIAVGDAAVTQLQGTYGYALPYRPALIFYNSAAEGDADLSGGPTVPFGAFVVGRAYPGSSGVVLLARGDRAFTRRTIIHELAHLYQYQIGLQLFDAPHWWIEGDAKAQEPADSIYHALGEAHQVAVGGGLPDLAGWDSRDYATESGLNEVMSIGSSFVTYLQQTYGNERRILFYGNWRQTGDFYSSFDAIYGQPLSALSISWREWILSNADSGIVPAGDDGYTPEIPAIMLPPIPEGMARVNVYWLNFRVSPAEDAEALALLSIGQLLLPIGRDESGEWLLVELPDGAQGWLFAEYLDFEGSIEDLTVSLY
jgi:hypothetical protein